MTEKSAKAPLLRNLYAFIVIVVLLLTFLFLNYFVFIPRQQAIFNKNSFRMLEQASVAFGQSINANKEYLSQRKDSSIVNPVIDTLQFNLTHPDGPRQEKPDSGKIAKLWDFHSSLKLLLRNCVVPAQSLPTQAKVIFRKDTVTINGKSLSLSDVFRPIQKMSQQSFSYFMVVLKDTNVAADVPKKQRGVILYKSADLAIEDTIYLDSILKREVFSAASIYDVKLAGGNYKLFMQPFSYNDNLFYMMGFVEARHYKIGFNSSSWSLLLIAGLLLLVIISLPVLKIFLLGKHENIVAADVRILMVSIIVMPVLVIVFLLSIKNYKVLDDMSNAILKELHNQVSRNFTNEVIDAKNQLKAYNKQVDTLHKFSEIAYPVYYKFFDNISWIDENGNQILKWDLSQKKNASTLLDLKKREYFQSLMSGKGYVFNGDTIYIQPAISWATGTYTVNIAMPSHSIIDIDINCPKPAKVCVIACNMYSAYYPATTKYYDFSIVDINGQELFHSESYRALQENLFKECNNDAAVVNAIKNRDSVLLNNVSLYGRDVKMRITPLEGLPFFLVSYYSKREQNFFVYHVVSFSFLTMSVLLGLLFAFLYGYYFFNKKNVPLYFNPRDSVWMRPSANYGGLYDMLLPFFKMMLCVYLVVILITGVIRFWINPNAHIGWLLLGTTFLTSFVTVTGYYLIKKDFMNKTHSSPEKRYKYINTLIKSRKIIGLFIIVFIAFLFGIDKYGESWQEWIFVLMLLPVAMGIYYIDKVKHFFSSINKIAFDRIYKVIDQSRQKKREEDKPSYFRQYIWNVSLAIMLISFIPAYILYQYGFEHEKVLQIKSRQMYLANEIVNRNKMMDSLYLLSRISRYNSTGDVAFRDSLKYGRSYGVYSAFSGIQPKDTVSQESPLRDCDGFYRGITSFLFMPADHVDFFNESYYHQWLEPDDSGHLSLLFNEVAAGEKKYLEIKTNVKQTGLDLFLTPNSWFNWALILTLFVFLLLHYKVIKSLGTRLFLINLSSEYAKCPVEAQWIADTIDMFSTKKTDAKAVADDSDKKLTSYEELCNKEDDLAKKKKYVEILKMQQIHSKSYEKIWNKCSNLEKYLMYDMALDGFTNYKNPDILFNLFTRGLLRQDDENGGFMLMTYSFRNYLISKAGSSEVEALRKEMSKGGTWRMVQNAFFAILIIIFAYLVITQQEFSTRIIAIVTGLVTLIPSLIRLFDKKTATT